MLWKRHCTSSKNRAFTPDGGPFHLQFVLTACTFHSSMGPFKISAPVTGCFSFLCSLRLSRMKSLSKFFYPTPSTNRELPGPPVPHFSAVDIQLLLCSGSNQLLSKCLFQSSILSRHYFLFSRTFSMAVPSKIGKSLQVAKVHIALRKGVRQTTSVTAALLR